MEEQLIAAVFKREPIWNPSHVLYKNVGVLKKLWKQVSEELKVDERVVKVKWKNMRAYFFKLLKNGEKKSVDGSEQSASTAWSLFDQLMFLKDVTDKDSNASLTGDEIESNIQEHDRQDENGAEASAHPRLLLPSDLPEYTPAPPKKKKRKVWLPTALTTVQQDNEELPDFESGKVEMQNEIDTDSDSDLLFLNSLLPFMKEFSLRQKLRLRTKIQDLILSELESLDRPRVGCQASALRQTSVDYVLDSVLGSSQKDPLQVQQASSESPIIIKEEFDTDITE